MLPRTRSTRSGEQLSLLVRTEVTLLTLATRSRVRVASIVPVRWGSSATPRREDENLPTHLRLVHRAVECEEPLLAEGEDVGRFP